MGGGGRSTVDVEIYGYDFDETNLYAEEVRQVIVNNVPGARNVRISRDKDRPELKVTIDKEKAAIHGLNTATVSQYIRNRVTGFTAGFLKEDGDEYNIVVRLKEEDRNSITDIQDLTIPTATGARIKLSEIATIEEYWAPQTIDRKSRQRYVRVISMPYETSLGELAAAIQTQIDQISRPSGISVVLAGDFEDQQKTFKDIFALLLLIILLVYIVMASQVRPFGRGAGPLAHGYVARYDRRTGRGDAGGYRGQERYRAGGLHQPDARPRPRAERGDRPVGCLASAPCAHDGLHDAARYASDGTQRR